MKAQELSNPKTELKERNPMTQDAMKRSLKTRPAPTAASKVDQIRSLLVEVADELGLVPRHVSIGTFAKLTEFSPAHIYRLMSREGLPYKDLPGGRRIPVDEALAWLDQWRRP